MRIIIVHFYPFQFGTAGKSTTDDVLHSLRDRDTGQFGTVGEGFVSDCFNREVRGPGDGLRNRDLALVLVRIRKRLEGSSEVNAVQGITDAVDGHFGFQLHHV